MTDREDDDILDAGYLPAIVRLRLGRAPYTLVVRYDDGQEMTTDMAGIVHKRRALAPLRDPQEFARVRVINDGDGVQWESGPDFSADGLRHLAEAQRDMTGRDFARWMARLNLSNNEAADALGATPRTIKAYKTRRRALPAAVTIACRAMERDRLLMYGRIRPRRPGRPLERRA
jgi:hypothetical protein